MQPPTEIAIELSRKFWSAKTFGPWDQNSWKNWSAGPLFSENFGPCVDSIMVRAKILWCEHF